MTDDEIIAVVQAHKKGKKIEVHLKADPEGYWTGGENPAWDFFRCDYRVAPEPRKPREFWIEPLKYDLCRIHSTKTDNALWHVREVLE